MRRVFVSSVVGGMELYRRAAKETIRRMGYDPIMCEDFGARAHSSERVCNTEVENSDIYILLLGARYGFKTDQGISVTQQEFRTAQALNKPILVFVQQLSDIEPEQRSFREEVENYHYGFFRGAFATESELKDELTGALRQIEHKYAAASEAEFKEVLKNSVTDLRAEGQSNAATLRLGFWPQPVRENDIDREQNKLDEYFMHLCSANILQLSAGYQPLVGKAWVGLKSKKQWDQSYFGLFENGLILLQTVPTVTRENSHFDSWFVPPGRIREIASGAAKLFQANGGLVSLELAGMEYKTVAELPEVRNGGVSIPMRPEKENSYFATSLQIPFSHASYLDWIDAQIKKLKRRFSEN